ncbi:MAG: DUF4252 domain-containing protein [Planctomycetota bacterium]
MHDRYALATLLLAGAGFLAATASADAVDHPGVVDIDWSSRMDGSEPTAKIELSGPVLRMMTAAAGRAAEFGDLVEQLQLIRVEVYEDLDKSVPTTRLAQRQAAKLIDAYWQSIVRVREDGEESVDVVVLPKGEDTIAGVAVLVAEPGELVFLNVAGDIDAVEFGERFGGLIGPLLEGELELEDLLDPDDEDEDWDDEDGEDDGDEDEDWEEDEED